MLHLIPQCPDEWDSSKPVKPVRWLGRLLTETAKIKSDDAFFYPSGTFEVHVNSVWDFPIFYVAYANDCYIHWIITYIVDDKIASSFEPPSPRIQLIGLMCTVHVFPRSQELPRWYPCRQRIKSTHNEIEWHFSLWQLSTEATLTNVATNLCQYYCRTQFSSPKITSLTWWPHFLCKQAGLIRGGLL